MKQFEIHESNIDRLRNKVKRIQKKCEKYGCEFYYNEIDTIIKDVEIDGELKPTKYIVVEVEGKAVINGWGFVASIDHTPEGNIIKSVWSIDVPEKYYTCGPECEHCHSSRHRKNTYLVYNYATQEFKQVGSACLKDYTDGLDAEVAAAYVSMFDSLIEGEAPSPGYHEKTYYDLVEILTYAYEFVKHAGYSSSDSAAISTKQLTACAIRCIKRRSDRYDEEMFDHWKSEFGWAPEENKSYVEDAVAWILSDDSETSTYFNNLKVICKLGYIDWSQLGYAVSILPTYYKHLQQVKREEDKAAKQEAESISNHVGAVGDKIEIANPEAEHVAGWATEWGWTTRYKFKDAAGNIYMWDTSVGVDTDKQIKSLIGKVKKHEEYNGVKQTWLTRCKVDYIELSPEPANNDVDKALDKFMELCK